MRKKILAIMILTLALVLVGCGEDDEKSKAKAPDTKAATSSADDTEAPDTEAPDTDAPEITEAPDTDAPDITFAPGTGTGLDDPFGEEIDNPTYNASPITFVVKGVKYTSPSDYLVVYNDEIGPIVYINNVFQMKMVRKDETFAEVKKSLDTLDDKAIGNGAESILEPATKKVNGRELAYFVVDIEGEQTMGILTESPDGKFCMGGQISILADKVNYDDLLNMYVSIADTATVTKEKDSTADEIDAQIKYITGKKISSSKLTYKTSTVDFKVPDGFYLIGESDGATSGSQFFESADLTVYVSIEEKAFPEDTAEYSIDASVQYEENAKKQVEKVGKHTVYICSSHYTSEESGKVFYDLFCKVDIDDQYTYVVTGSWTDNDKITFDNVKTFLNFEE